MTKKILPFFMVALLGLVSAFFVQASVFALLLLVIAFAALSRLEHQWKSGIMWLLVISTLATTVGMTRFIFREALPGIAEARGRASSKRAVSLLREILFAQDAARRYAMIDPDGDGIGSAGLMGELCGETGARGGEKLETPPLDLRYAPRVPTRSGPATEQDGYLMIICIPGQGQPWVTAPSQAANDEAAETSWIAYAWPAHEEMEHQAAYFIDQNERILESQNLLSPGGSTPRKLRLVGPGEAPQCEDALAQETRDHWTQWSSISPRKSLPGVPAPL
jgi:hypothetical protein